MASIDVDSKTNEITRFDALLDQIGDLRGVVVTADALHCHRDHVAYLAGRGAHWILTAKGNQPILHQQLAGLLWRQTPDADRNTDRGHGRREFRTLKILSVSAGIEFPMRRRRSRPVSPTSPPATRHHARNANRPLALLGIT